MIKVKNIDTWGFDHAIRGMRNPLNSWDKSDSYIELCDVIVGDADLALMHKLYKSGDEHRKYLRQIFVSMDIVAPLYWWKEFDTYKVGTVANSCSTMHKIHAKEFTLDDFSIEHIELLKIDSLGYYPFNHLIEDVIKVLNYARNEYIKTKDKRYWWQMIQLLPSSYNQRRTVTMNYENAVNMIRQRENHKLDEWRDFVKELQQLPYIKQIMEGDSKC